MTSRINAELRRLINALHDDTIQQEGFARLQDILRQEPGGRELHIAYSDLHTRLAQLQSQSRDLAGEPAAVSGLEKAPGEEELSVHVRARAGVSNKLGGQASITNIPGPISRTDDAVSIASGSPVSSARLSPDCSSAAKTTSSIAQPTDSSQATFSCLGSLFRKQVSIGFAASGFIAACLVGVLAAPWLLSDFDRIAAESQPPALQPGKPKATVGVSTAYERAVATIVGGVDVALDGPPPVGNRIGLGTIRVRRGLARVVFDSGAVVVVQGPSEIDIVEESTCRLVSGAMSVKVSSEADLFRVEADGLQISERDTEFAVRRVRHNDTELHVFNGRLQLVDLRGGNTRKMHVREGRGLRWRSGNDAMALVANRQGFVSDTELLQREEDIATQAYSRWRAYSARWRSDPSLALWYDFSEKPGDALVARCGVSGEHIADSEQSHPRWVDGRWSGSKSLLFDGRTDVLKTDDHEDLRLQGEFTLATWIQIRSNPGSWCRIVGKGDGVRRNYGLWLHPDGSLQWQVCPDNSPDYSNNWERFSLSSEVAVADKWHHVVGTFGKGRMRLYLNGELQASRVVPAEVITSDAPLTIGRVSNIPGHESFFCGEMGELLLLHRELTPGEVQQSFSAGQASLPTADSTISVSPTI